MGAPLFQGVDTQGISDEVFICVPKYILVNPRFVKDNMEKRGLLPFDGFFEAVE